MTKVRPTIRTDILNHSLHLHRILAGKAYYLKRAGLVFSVSFVYGIVLIYSMIVLLSSPSLSFVLDTSSGQPAQVAWVLPGSTMWQYGVRAGDTVRSLDHQPPPPQTQKGMWYGDTIEVDTISGNTIQIDADLIRQGRNTWPLLSLSPWFLLLGTLVYLRAPSPHVSGTTYGLFSAAAFALALAPGSIADKPIAAIAEWVALVVFATYFALFFLSFPDDLLGYNRWFRAALLILSSGVILLSFLTLLQPLLYEVAALLRLVILLVYMLLGVGVGIFQFVTKRNQPERSGLAIISSGTLISILPFIGLFLLPTLFGRTPILIAEYAILPLAILPASFTYAILRHNVINISLLQRWLVHMSVWSILLVSYASIIYGAQWLVEGLERSTRSMIFAIGLVLFVGVSFDWLRTRLQQIFDRVIFKDSYEYRQALRALSYDLSNATNIDTLSISLSDPLRRLMNLDFALLLIQEPHGPRAVGGVGTYDPTFLNDLATAANNISINPQVISLGYGYLRVLVAPLRTHDVTVGHLCLGPKANGEAFRVTDKDLLATLSGQVAGVVQNAQLVAALQRQVKELDLLNDRLQHAQEKERARVSADIHDEPLQTAISLQRQLREVDSGSTLAAPIASSQLLVTQLRRVCLNMRPATLDDLGLFAALDQLIQEQSECHDIPIRLEVNANSIVEALPPSTTIVLYRAVQEALTNSLRHARPHSIEVCITQHECKVQLWVNDDGVGFTVPQRLEQLVTEGHLGLIGLRERVHHYGGNVFITSTIGKGTSIHIELPFQPETDV